MKNLANCKPSEFLSQSNKIRKSVEKWLTVTDIMNIRQHQPQYEDGMTKAEREKALREQVKINLSQMLDSILTDHPQETLELLALLCFVEPEDVDNHPMAEYIMAFTELINDKAVLDFFISLVKLGQKGILTA
jgi:hypothetical protein